MPVDAPERPRAAAEPSAAPEPPGPPPPRRRHRHVIHGGLSMLVGAVLGAAALATIQATGTLPPPPIGGDPFAEQDADVVVSLRESYINRLVAEHAARTGAAGPLQNLRVDVLPGRRMEVRGDVAFLNQPLEASASGLLSAADGRVRVEFDAVRVGTLNLPATLGETVAAPINAELDRLSADEQFRIVDVATAADRVIVRLAAPDSSQSRQGAAGR
jgi:hypothetical protein